MKREDIIIDTKELDEIKKQNKIISLKELQSLFRRISDKWYVDDEKEYYIIWGGKINIEDIILLLTIEKNEICNYFDKEIKELYEKNFQKKAQELKEEEEKEKMTLEEFEEITASQSKQVTEWENGLKFYDIWEERLTLGEIIIIFMLNGSGICKFFSDKIYEYPIVEQEKYHYYGGYFDRMFADLI